MPGRDEDAPDAILGGPHLAGRPARAATLQGAIFVAVKAALDRAGAAATRRFAGAWPG
ncbi:hypothetical protein ABZ079_35055 [Streptomyces sp. NPDC006314]|uniref:hypothetical protein n=1 Tax=Streptomyces sp. NPDC006314 TaxID=3154475 RepID=UPI0033B8E926